MNRVTFDSLYYAIESCNLEEVIKLFKSIGFDEIFGYAISEYFQNPAILIMTEQGTSGDVLLIKKQDGLYVLPPMYEKPIFISNDVDSDLKDVLWSNQS